MERRGGGLRRRVGARGGGEGAYAAVVNTGVLWMARDGDGRFIVEKSQILYCCFKDFLF